MRALRLTFVGELGWELHVPFDAIVDVYQHLMNAGKQFGIVNAGYRAIDSLSIEKGKDRGGQLGEAGNEMKEAAEGEEKMEGGVGVVL